MLDYMHLDYYNDCSIMPSNEVYLLRKEVVKNNK